MLKLFNTLSRNAIITYIFFFVCWQAITYCFNIPNYFIPSPTDIFHYMVAYKSVLASNTLVTVTEALLGLTCAIIASVIFGVVALYSALLVSLTYRLLLLIQIIPLMAITPLIIIWFGFSMGAKVLIVFIVCLFPCLVSFLRGSLSIDRDYFTLLQSMRATKFQIFRFVIFPSSFYSLFSGLKIAVTYSISSAVIAEYLGAEKGIGVYITRSISSFNNDALFANVVCIVFTTLILYKLLVVIEKKLILWNKNNTVKENNYELL